MDSLAYKAQSNYIEMKMRLTIFLQVDIEV